MLSGKWGELVLIIWNNCQVVLLPVTSVSLLSEWKSLILKIHCIFLLVSRLCWFVFGLSESLSLASSAVCYSSKTRTWSDSSLLPQGKQSIPSDQVPLIFIFFLLFWSEEENLVVSCIRKPSFTLCKHFSPAFFSALIDVSRTHQLSCYLFCFRYRANLIAAKENELSKKVSVEF